MNKSSKFFLIVPPGLEKLALFELSLKCPDLEGFQQAIETAQIVRGGIELSAKEPQGWELNHRLKIPVRVLQRILEFRARDFPDLFKKTQRFAWSDYLRQGPLKIQVSTHRSRLKIKEKIEQTIQQSLIDAQRRQPWRKAFLELPQGVWINLDQDVVKVSIDTSGHALYKRGQIQIAHPAPLRENLAAAMFAQLLSLIGQKSLQSLDLLDPFCGTGTLLFEAHEFLARRKGPYAYEQFPVSGSRRLVFDHKIQSQPQMQRRFLGFDLQAEFIEACLGRVTQNNYKNFYFAQQDFRQSHFEELKNPFWVITNPPFGIRLTRATDPIVEGLRSLFEQPLCQGLSLLWPKDQLGLWGKDFEWDQILETRQGGLPVVFCLKNKIEGGI